MRERVFSEKIGRAKKEGLLRKIKDRSQRTEDRSQKSEVRRQRSEVRERKSEGTVGSRIVINGIEYINFASNDYLGLAGNTLIGESAKKAIDGYGFGAGASRLLSGGTKLHGELEKEIAAFKGSKAALVFNSGYAANTGAIPSIAGPGDVIFSDELNHASIIDGCRLSRAKTVIFKHRDAGHLSALIEKEKVNRKIVITDTIFSMDGDIAPLKDIYDICRSLNSTPDARRSTLLYLDDAHGTGVLGEGKGALTHFGLKHKSWIIQMGTFSKALGSFGAFIAADRDVIKWLINSARGFIFSTALPSCTVAASMAGLKTIRGKNSLVKKLWRNRERLYRGLQKLGLNTLSSETPIIPVVVGDVEATLRLSGMLGKHHIYAPAIRPPTVRTPRIRFTVTAAHTNEDIDRVIEVLSQI